VPFTARAELILLRSAYQDARRLTVATACMTASGMHGSQLLVVEYVDRRTLA
jgi:hypothetical protein